MKVSAVILPLIILLCAEAESTTAQDVYNNTEMYINGASLYIDGEVRNEGQINNEGLIRFTGDWRNDGTYYGEGSVEACGNSPQILAHAGQTFKRLVIDGWGTKYVEGETKIRRELTLKHGIVQVSTDDRLFLNAGALATGGSLESYVDGPLTVEGNGYKFFPVGKNGIYAPIEFLDVAGNSAQYSMEVFEDAPTVAVENVVVRRSLYWQRINLVGEFGSSAVAIDYERSFFENPEGIIMLVGNSFDESFRLINELDRSTETDKILTRVPVSEAIIMLGEISKKWTDADYYLSTALSPHAAHSANKSVKIFGDRLSAGQFLFQVFDRWGDLVYENISLEDMQSNGWDGRCSRGHELATGTYPYRLSAYDKLGNRFERKGIITIVQ